MMALKLLGKGAQGRGVAAGAFALPACRTRHESGWRRVPGQATLIGKTVYVFGGEDASRRPLRELHCLDLTTMTWASPATSGTPPAARSAHVAVVYKASRLLLLCLCLSYITRQHSRQHVHDDRIIRHESTCVKEG
jgi:hypothetical protein